MTKDVVTTRATMAPRRRLSRRTRLLGAVLSVLLAITVLAGCTLAPPSGPSPLRYRDQIFSNVTVTSNIQYGSAPDANGNPVALMLDLYRPTGDTQTNRPALVWVHGGSFSAGDKASGVPPDIATNFAKIGYVVVSINYRLVSSPCGSGGLTPECVTAAFNAQHDAEAAVRWLRANASTYGIDPTRIAIGGESAGGITATLVGVNSADAGDSGNPGFPSNVGAFVSISGGLPGGLLASAGDSPGLLFHGTADTVVPDSWSIQTAVALLNSGVPAFLELQDGAGHVPYVQYHDLFVSQSEYFLYDFLDLANAAGQPTSAARAFERQLPTLRKKYPQFSRRLSRLHRTYPQYTK